MPPPYVRYRLERFLNPSSEKDTEEGVQSLLSGFFRELGVNSIFYRSSGSMKIEEAIITLSKRLSSRPIIMDGGTGIAFQMEIEGKPKWNLMLHRDVFFRAELRAFVRDSKGLTRRQGKRLVTTEAADLFTNFWGVCGSPVDIYLSHKLHELRARHVHPLMSEGSLAAGVQFRQLCRQVWQGAHPHDVAPRFLSEWGWGLSRFANKYDKLLVHSVGAERLEHALGAMGIGRNSWISENAIR